MYKEYFGFSELPFSTTGDPRFFFSNALYQEGFTGLRWGIKLRKGLMVMTGASGTGKTSLLRVITERFEPTIQTALISTHIADPNELLRQMLAGLGMPHPSDDRHTLMRELGSYLRQQFENDYTVAVLLDDAQNLDNRTLKQVEVLSNFEADSTKLLQIVLVGRPELEAKLEAPALRSLKQNVAVWCRLAPLTNQEVASYIDYRLNEAGQNSKGLFPPETVNEIALASNGIPTLINTICDRALSGAFSTGQKIILPAMIHQVSHGIQGVEEPELNAPTSFLSGFHKREEDVDGSEPAAASIDTRDEEAEDQKPAEEWRWDVDEFGSESKSKQPVRSVNNTRRLELASFLAVVLLLGSAIVFYLEPTQPLKTAQNSGTVQEINDSQPSAREPVQETSFRATSPIDLPAAQEVSPVPPAKTSSTAGSKAKLEPRRSRQPSVARKIDPLDVKVYVHTSVPRDRLVLEELGDALRVKGYTIQDTRLTSGRTRGDIRFFFPDDRREAERLKSLVESELGKRGYPVSLQLLQRDGTKFQYAAPGKIEVWLPPLPKAG